MSFFNWVSNSPWLLSLAGMALLVMYYRQFQAQQQRQQRLRDIQQLDTSGDNTGAQIAGSGQSTASVLSLAGQNQADPFADNQDLSAFSFIAAPLRGLYRQLQKYRPAAASRLNHYFQGKLLQLQLILPPQQRSLSQWLQRQWLTSLAMAVPLFLLVWVKLPTEFFLVKLITAVVTGFFSALIILFWRLQRRLQQSMQACEQALPQALEQLARAVSAGMGIHQALSQVVVQLSPNADVEASVDNESLGRIILARELEWLLSRLRIGDPPEQVIELAGLRLPLISYRFFGMTLLLNLQTGGRLAQVLARQSAQLKEAQRAKHKLDALTSEPRLSANVVAAIPILMLSALAWLNPGHLEFLLDDASGQQLLAYSLGSIAFGLFLIRLMVIGGGR